MDIEAIRLALAQPQTAPSQLRNKPKAKWRAQVRETLLQVHGPFCWLCNEEIVGDPTLDHIVPHSKRGRNSLSNLRLAHDHCNVRRGNGKIPTLELKLKWAIASGVKTR